MRKLIPLLLLLFAGGCSSVEVVNTGSLTVTVQVTVPDRSGAITRVIRSGESSVFITEHGGTYSVATIPSESYRTTLENLQSMLTRRLFNESITLTAEEAERIGANLKNLDDMLERLRSNADGVSCSGRIPDWESATVIISYDEMSGSSRIVCG